MNLYPLLRPLLFSLNPETAHEVTLKLLNAAYSTGLSKLIYPEIAAKPVTVMGLNFSNPLGLAAGLDKNGDYINALAALGFGFVEIGTVTPRPQPGNPKPRLFRLPEHQAIINRMGFNNLGIDHLLAQVKQSRYPGILGINIGKNFDTPIENAADDYLIGLRKAYSSASYITINISSPNTKNLRQLQQGDDIKSLMSALKEEQLKLQQQHGNYVPLALKIAPDLNADEITHIAKLLLAFEIDGVIATNTTIARDKIAGHPLANEAGGLSGAPVKEKSTMVVRGLAAELNGKIPIIAAGGILSAADAREKLAAGASLLQIYSGLIYRGPQLIADIIKGLN
ncbi:MAG: quinone-dependent dihydroorotate dehydrogenase [Methylobacter sp.]|nr:quinone-dependent dihydroorotate dehydrogenase [Methylobacter sp.]MDP2098866.1 quinone-dependent dihydroorotate dehydrogenase [Methylobacter sp.]MDP2428154.1 quinone-dependent dihydroorotate dehydrogenase [Methylobacter sp.]MDP3054378.1 quinone-dependent dihydroorotate dehydrogenase [Methylobacter sp.]MDP3362498.1 quinone-dependent dihydroorotate dehydrogenase [Methylobacter sp.]